MTERWAVLAVWYAAYNFGQTRSQASTFGRVILTQGTHLQAHGRSIREREHGWLRRNESHPITIRRGILAHLGAAQSQLITIRRGMLTHKSAYPSMSAHNWAGYPDQKRTD